ncbi:MAG: twin-arginine translocase subunit TatB [Alphaproteobacteria bacterium]|nr:twin-arginine translocase subunit TatB [Alphaproteobacteria bacterium]
MLDLSWGELLIVGAVAVVVIGPKELPKLLHGFGKWAGRARALAREFQGHLDELARQAEIDEMKKQVEKMNALDPTKEIKQALDPKAEMDRLAASMDITGIPQPDPKPAAVPAPEAAPAAENATPAASPAPIAPPPAAGTDPPKA